MVKGADIRETKEQLVFCGCLPCIETLAFSLAWTQVCLPSFFVSHHLQHYLLQPTSDLFTGPQLRDSAALCVILMAWMIYNIQQIPVSGSQNWVPWMLIVDKWLEIFGHERTFSCLKCCCTVKCEIYLIFSVMVLEQLAQNHKSQLITKTGLLKLIILGGKKNYKTFRYNN